MVRLSGPAALEDPDCSIASRTWGGGEGGWGRGLVEGVEFADTMVKTAVKSISGMAGDVGELVAEGLSY